MHPTRIPSNNMMEPRVASLMAWLEQRDRDFPLPPAGMETWLGMVRGQVAVAVPSVPVDLAAAWEAAAWQIEGGAWLYRHDFGAARAALERALRGYERALALARLPGLATVLRRRFSLCQVQLGEIDFARHEWGEALRWFCRARDFCVVHGHSHGLGTVLGHIADIYAVAGLWALELELALEARRVAELEGDRATLGRVDLGLARAYRKLRDFPEARAKCEEARSIFALEQGGADELRALVELAALELAEGRPVEALERLRAAEPLSARVGEPGLELSRLAELARACLGSGRAREAEQVASIAIDLAACQPAGKRDHVLAPLRLVLARALLADARWREGEKTARAVLAQVTAAGAPCALESEAHAVLAEAARGACAWKRACEHEVAKSQAYERHFNHQSALRIRVLAVRHEIDFARASASREREERIRLEQSLAEVRARLMHGGAPQGARAIEEVTPAELEPLGLSARESEVLLWTARGKTNDEIAAILGRSRSTVKKHLEGSFRKLNVENRLAAATTALQFLARRSTSESQMEADFRPDVGL